MRQDIPHGTVTFLFTDIEGSTALLDELGSEGYGELLSSHHRVCRKAWGEHGGVEVDTAGDAFFVAFPTASAGLAAAAEAQEALAELGLRVRMGVHTGEVSVNETGYVGLEVHRAARIAAAAHGGQIVVSSSTAALVGSDRLVDLGEHRFKDLAAPERVYQLGVGDFPPLKSLYRSNLPVPATPFVGRERELGEVVGLLRRAELRLLTLSGPGGTGKTRLSLQAAAQASDDFSDGVFWVPLAPLRDPSLVVTAVAQTLDVKEQAGSELLDLLSEHLVGKKLLLLLDNAEHLLPEVAGTISRLRGVDGPKLVVTSRERLQVAGEHLYPVPELVAEEAAELYLARAAEVGVTLTPDESVRELCARLDQLPLALELAAARAVLFTPAQLTERLAQRLDLLKGGRDADPRQQTLRATIEWSYELLDSAEKRLFRALSVFAGGCTYEAAEQVAGADPDTLQSLIDKSLVRRRESELGPRYWMLETIREYASQQLVKSDQETELRRRHAEWFCAFAEEAEPQLRDREQSRWLSRLDEDHANLRQALDYAHTLPDAELEVRLAGACWYFWLLRTNLREATERLERALARADEQPPALRAQLLDGLSVIAWSTGNVDDGLVYADESLRLRRALGDSPGLLRALLGRGQGTVAAGDLEGARPFFEECRELAERVGDEWFLGIVGGTLSDMALQEGDFVQAERLAGQAYEAMRNLGDEYMAPIVLGNLASAELELGKVRSAAERLCEALNASLEAGASEAMVFLVDSLATVAERTGQNELAAQLSGAAATALAGMGVENQPFERDRRQRMLEALRGRLGAERLAALVAEGEAMALDEAAARALALVPARVRSLR